MCLYPRLIENRKYKRNKKNGWQVPPIKDQRARYVPVGCGKCIECRKQKSREWLVRLQEDLKVNTNAKFITLTYSTENLRKIIEDDKESIRKKQEKINNLLAEYTSKSHKKAKKLQMEIKKPLAEMTGYQLDNELVTRSIRLFLERWRKKYKKSLRHWLVTELGHGNTEHIHIHGIVWTDKLEELENIWSYGYVWKGKLDIKTGKLENYVNERTVNYIVKYLSKVDEKHLNYQGIVLTSSGIGANYKGRNEYNGIETDETYRTSTGHRISLPIYWRNKIYNDEQKEALWLQRLDKQERWVCGERIDIKNGEKEYYEALKYHRERTSKLGYPTPEFMWSVREYEEQRRKLIQEYRLGPKGTGFTLQSLPNSHEGKGFTLQSGVKTANTNT
ncbi:MAG: replication initiator protein [Microviridae sp.]|nr:MAG: replication initiator protein [Microviridae sp.]